jgi:hypothetical protein
MKGVHGPISEIIDRYTGRRRNRNASVQVVLKGTATGRNAHSKFPEITAGEESHSLRIVKGPFDDHGVKLKGGIERRRRSRCLAPLVNRAHPFRIGTIVKEESTRNGIGEETSYVGKHWTRQRRRSKESMRKGGDHRMCRRLRAGLCRFPTLSLGLSRVSFVRNPLVGFHICGGRFYAASSFNFLVLVLVAVPTSFQFRPLF